jgi:hypothetical protein
MSGWVMSELKLHDHPLSLVAAVVESQAGLCPFYLLGVLGRGPQDTGRL